MDVQKVGKATLEGVKSKQPLPTESISFQEVMSKGRTNVVYEKLTKLVTEIEDQGKVLSEKRTVDHLRKYKKLVKEFMDEAVKNGLQLEESGGLIDVGARKFIKSSKRSTVS